MNSIFGIVSRNEAPIEQEWALAMQSALDHWGAKVKNEKKGDTFSFGKLSLLRNDKQVAAENDYVVIADIALFNQTDLKQKLGLRPSERHSDASLVLHAYWKWGQDCPNYFNGEFAFVIYNQGKKEIFVARDHHGIKPLYYFLNQPYFAFATEIKSLLSLPFVTTDIDEQYVADFICRIWLDNTQTLYRNIKRFPAAHSAVIDKNGIQLKKYWNPENSTLISYQKESDYVDAFEEKLIQAIKDRAAGEIHLGTELSGGLDSSLVSLLLNQQKGKEVSAYGYVLPSHLEGKSLYSDVDRVNKVSKVAGIEKVELLTDVDKGMLDSLAWNLTVQDEPPFEFNPLFRDSLYQKMQAKGERTLFSGFGGDEMVSSQASGYLKQLYLEGKRNLLRKEITAISKRKKKAKWLLYSSLYLKLMTNDRFLANAVKSFRSISGNASNLQKKLKHRPLIEDWFNQLNMQERFQAYQERYTRNGNFMEDQVRRMQEPHVAFRLEYQAHAARSFQIDYRYPLLDVRLIEFYLGLPTELKASHGKGRYIFKKVMERHLPKDFVWNETKKGSSNPQVLSRTLNDGKKLEQRLFSIHQNHPVWSYLDYNKLRTNRVKFKDWNQSTTDFVYLLLADKLK